MELQMELVNKTVAATLRFLQDEKCFSDAELLDKGMGVNFTDSTWLNTTSCGCPGVRTI